MQLEDLISPKAKDWMCLKGVNDYLMDVFLINTNISLDELTDKELMIVNLKLESSKILINQLNRLEDDALKSFIELQKKQNQQL